MHYSVTFNCDFVPLNRIKIKRESTSYVSFNSLRGERKITNNMPKLGSPSRTSPMVNLWKINASLYFFQFIELEGAPVIINKAEIIRNFGWFEF